MDGVKLISIMLIVVALFGMWLESKGQLESSVQAIVMPGASNLGRTDGPTVGALIFALLVYLFIISLLPANGAVVLTAIVVAGALIANHQRAGKNDVINQIVQLFGGVEVTPALSASAGTGGLSGLIGTTK